MVNGYTGKILLVDLTSGTISKEQFPEDIYRNYIGGIGLGAKILYDHMKAHVDPLGAENVLGFVPGLLTGTPTPMASKFVVVTKSPLTDTWGDANSGGLFGSEIKAAGYDAIFFFGVSPKPVYLLIQDDEVELRDAVSFWGRDTSDTVKMLRRENKNQRLRIACIGPAGEHLSLISSVVTDETRVAGRSGTGAVMGSKKLKAIAVRGHSKLQIADIDRFKKLRRDTLALLRDVESIPFLRMLGNTGTCAGIMGTRMGNTPIKNWNLAGEQAFPDYIKLGPENILKYQVGRTGCGNCPVNCGGIVAIGEGENTTETRKPEYETLAAFGPMLFNSDAESIIKANEICDRTGLDTISAGSVIAFAMECYENGIISKEETEGIELTWGNSQAMLEILERMAQREGFGDTLADGVRRAASRIGKGTVEYAIHVHGQEPGYHDPRFSPYRGLGYISNPAPGRHMVSNAAIRLEGEGKLGPYTEIQVPQEGDENERRGQINAIASSYSQVFESCGLCLFALSGGSNYPMVEFINAATGWDLTVADVIAAGKRILTTRQAFNIREGLSVKDFHLPERLARPATMGPSADRRIDFETLRSSYYKAMGWNDKATFDSLVTDTNETIRGIMAGNAP